MGSVPKPPVMLQVKLVAFCEFGTMLVNWVIVLKLVS